MNRNSGFFTCPFIGFLFFSLLIFPGIHVFAQVYEGPEADAIVPGAELVWKKEGKTIPDYIRLRPEHLVPQGEMLTFVKHAFGLTPHSDLFFLQSETDRLGFTHERYLQIHSGIPVETSMLILHVKDGKLHAANGEVFSEIQDANMNNLLSEEDALADAIDHIDAHVYKWQVPEEEAFLKRSQGGTASFYPAGELVFAPDAEGKELTLSWKFDIYAHRPISRRAIFVDAHTGAIVNEFDKIHTVDAVGTAVTKFSGTRSIVSDNFGANLFRLREAGRGNGIETYNMQAGTNYGNAVDFTDTDNVWNNVNPAQDEVATDAHWGAEMTYDYFFQQHGRNSIDGNGFALVSYVHYDVNYFNAFWDGSRMTYGDGSGSADPLTSLDIAGHEITHGLTNFTANLIYQNESGALNESFSDIFGNSVEYFARGTASSSWQLGEDIGVVIRNMSNPGAHGDPDTYQAGNWFTGTGDNGGVHTNSGVQNYWYYLLVEGETGTNDLGDLYTVPQIGTNRAESFDKASQVAFRNLTVYLTPGSQYADARFYAIQSANDIFGACSPEVDAVTRAWYAVGVGADWVIPSPVSDFSVGAASSCVAPFTVAFSNVSTNTSSYIWNFGDGNTSTGFNPTHTYSQPGTYSVTLSANGGCGADVETKTGFITIGNPPDPLAADVYQCAAGPALLLASGSGTLNWYDAVGNYLSSGPSYRTPNLTATTTYQVEAEVGANESVGPLNTAFGGVGIITTTLYNTWYLMYFNPQPWFRFQVDAKHRWQ